MTRLPPNVRPPRLPAAAGPAPTPGKSSHGRSQRARLGIERCKMDLGFPLYALDHAPAPRSPIRPRDISPAVSPASANPVRALRFLAPGHVYSLAYGELFVRPHCPCAA